jgi:hypothetical protein
VRTHDFLMRGKNYPALNSLAESETWQAEKKRIMRSQTTLHP